MAKFYTSEEIKQEMDALGYISNEYLLWEATNIVNSMLSNETRKGQDISAICLAGPPGSGKTEFAKVVYKIVDKLIDQDTEFVSYQCDPTTGRENLFEDINVTAVIKNDPANVIVQGALLKAISKVNEGKKVVLFLDEYDKAREETDSFLLQFLQSGEISTGQTDVKQACIQKQENKKNLQVILCKNDNREKLSGPLERRLEFIYLEAMKPQVFYTVASRAYPVDTSLVNFVSVVYEIMYNNKDKFERLPACAEMLDAIKHARDYVVWGAPNYIVYKKIMECMVKDKNDQPMFVELLSKSKDVLGFNIQDVFNEQKRDSVQSVVDFIITNRYRTAFENRLKKINQDRETIFKTGRLGKLSKDYQFEEHKINSIVPNFTSEQGKTKRGVDITNGSLNWVRVGEIVFEEFDVEKYHQTMQKLAESEEDMYIYENGYRYVYSFGDFNLNIICSQENGKTSVEFYFDNPIVPSVVFNEINSFVNTLCKSQPNQEKEILSFDCIIYSERDLSRIKGMNSLDYKLFTFTTEIENASEKIIDFAKEICSKQDKFDAETLLKITEMAMPKEEDVAEDDKTM